MFDLSKGIAKICKNKKPKDVMLLMVLGGLILLILFCPMKKSGEKEAVSFFSSETGYGTSQFTEDETEYRLERILEQMEGIGEVDVMITRGTEGDFYGTDNPPIEGIVVVCEDGNKSEKVLLIHDVIQALFSVDSHKIKVVKGVTLNNTVKESEGEKE